MPDPKLKQAMGEIQPILARYDIAGVVILSSRTHTEYLHELTPTWACLRIEDEAEDGVMIRIRIKRADFPTAAEYQAAARDTVGLIAGLADTLGDSRGLLMGLLAELGKRIEFSHWTRHEKP